MDKTTILDALKKISTKVEQETHDLSKKDVDLIINIAYFFENEDAEVCTNDAIRFLGVSGNRFHTSVRQKLKRIKYRGDKTIYYKKNELREYKKRYLQN